MQLNLSNYNNNNIIIIINCYAVIAIRFWVSSFYVAHDMCIVSIHVRGSVYIQSLENVNL